MLRPPGRRGGLTLGVRADQSGEVGQECERGEVGQVGDLQRVQQGAQALSTEPEGSGVTWALCEAILYCTRPPETRLERSTATGCKSPLTSNVLLRLTANSHSASVQPVSWPTLKEEEPYFPRLTKAVSPAHPPTLGHVSAALTANHTVQWTPSTSRPDPPLSLICPWPPQAAPEGLALDAHPLGQAAQKGRRALLHHVLHAQPPLDVLQQPPQEAQEMLGCADGARHRLCRETESAGTGGCVGQQPGGVGWGTSPCSTSSGSTGLARWASVSRATLASRRPSTRRRYSSRSRCASVSLILVGTQDRSGNEAGVQGHRGTHSSGSREAPEHGLLQSV